MMDNFDVQHYLDIYSARKKMQEEGLTNPSKEIKKFTEDFVQKLESLPLNEQIILKEESFFDTNGNLIIKISAE